MNYEILNLQEKTVAGLMARTNNLSPDMAGVIGGLWMRFFESGVYGAIENKRSGKTMGIYTDYAGDETCDYSFLTACEVDGTQNLPEGTVVKTMPAGKYAKFVVEGDLHKAIAEFWQELWKMDLPRAFTFDFEEYQNSDPQNAVIHVYISLK